MKALLLLRLLAPLAVAIGMARMGTPGPFFHLGAFTLFAVLLDWAFQAPGRLPTYRRHGLVFLLALAFALPALIYGALGSFACDLAGIILGLGIMSLPLLASRRLRPFRWQRGPARRPDPSRPLILVADPHWNDTAFPGLREAAAAHPDADWLFLGDLFDVWVGIPGMENEAHRAFLAWVDERRAAGAWVGLWLGNREYFLDGHAERFDLMGEGIGGVLEGEGLAFEHGDLINAEDRAYRTWNLLSRSGPLWLFFRLLPGATAHGLAARIEAKLRTTNREYKLAFPREAFRQAAQAAAPATFLTGHFHTEEREANGHALPWAFEGRFQLWHQRSVKPLNLPPV